MDINVYREFAEIVLQGSYSAAAKELNLSQPTLSRHVSTLEKELNAKLVADVLPVRLTPAGDTVFQAALRMVDLYAGMQDDLAELRHAAPARVRIHDTPALRPLTARIAAAANEAMRAERRTVVEYVAPRTGKAPTEAVAEGLCDFSFVQLVEEADGERRAGGADDGGIATDAPPTCGGDVRATPLPGASDRLVFGLPRGSALAGQDAVRLAALRHETFLMLASKASEPLKASFAAACRRRGFRPAVKMVPCSRYEEFYLLDHGDGVHVLAAGDLAADATFAGQLGRRMVLVPADEADGLCLRWHALHRDLEGGGAFARFLALLAAAEAAPA